MGKLVLLCGLLALANAKTISVTSPVPDVTSQPTSDFPSTQYDVKIEIETPKQVELGPAPRQRFEPDPTMLRPNNRFYYHIPISPETGLSEFRPDFRPKDGFAGFVPYFAPPEQTRQQPMEVAPSSVEAVTATPESAEETTYPSSSEEPETPTSDVYSTTTEEQTSQQESHEEVPQVEEEASSFMSDDREDTEEREPEASSSTYPETDEGEPIVNEEPASEDESQPDETPEEPSLTEEQQRPQEPQEPQEPQLPNFQPQQPAEGYDLQDQLPLNPYYEYNAYMNPGYQPKWFDEPRPPMTNYYDEELPANNIVESEMDVMRGNFDRGFA